MFVKFTEHSWSKFVRVLTVLKKIIQDLHTKLSLFQISCLNHVHVHAVWYILHLYQNKLCRDWRASLGGLMNSIIGVIPDSWVNRIYSNLILLMCRLPNLRRFGHETNVKMSYIKWIFSPSVFIRIWISKIGLGINSFRIKLPHKD